MNSNELVEGKYKSGRVSHVIKRVIL